MCSKKEETALDAAIKIVEEYEKKAFKVPLELKAVTLSAYITEIKEKLHQLKLNQ